MTSQTFAIRVPARTHNVPLRIHAFNVVLFAFGRYPLPWREDRGAITLYMVNLFGRCFSFCLPS